MNIDEVQYNGEFEKQYGLQFCCSECIVELMNKNLFSSSEDSECNSNEEIEAIILHGSTDINFSEQGDEIEENDESDESSKNESSNDTVVRYFVDPLNEMTYCIVV